MSQEWVGHCSLDIVISRKYVSLHNPGHFRLPMMVISILWTLHESNRHTVPPRQQEYDRTLQSIYFFRENMVFLNNWRQLLLQAVLDDQASVKDGRRTVPVRLQSKAYIKQMKMLSCGLNSGPISRLDFQTRFPGFICQVHLNPISHQGICSKQPEEQSTVNVWKLSKGSTEFHAATTRSWIIEYSAQGYQATVILARKRQDHRDLVFLKVNDCHCQKLSLLGRAMKKKSLQVLTTLYFAFLLAFFLWFPRRIVKVTRRWLELNADNCFKLPK